MTEDYPIIDMETFFMSWKFRVKIDCLSPKNATRVINTTLGLFKLLRLPRRMKNASKKFKRTIDNTVKGLVATICVQDDVLVHGRKKRQCEKRWMAVQGA